MNIAVRIEPNGRSYIQKELKPEIDYSQPPYNFTITTIDDKYSDCEGIDFNGLEFSVEKYSARKKKETNLPTITQLKQNLEKTDYIADKLAEAIAEYIATGNNTNVLALRARYAEQLQDRQSWRDKINELEA